MPIRSLIRKLVLSAAFLIVADQALSDQVPAQLPQKVIPYSVDSTGNYANPASAANPSPINIGQAGTYSQITITAGGSDQTLATPTNGFEIVNPDPAEQCNMTEGAAAVAGTGVILPPGGGGYKTPDVYKPSGAPHVLCATTGHKLTYRIW
jgi:hypothetical protein